MEIDELDKLIQEYKSLPQFCGDNVDYGDKKAVKKNNRSMDRMRKIVETIKDKFGKQGIDKLTALLDIEDHKTNLSIATNLLNQIDVDAETEAKALEVIRRVSLTDELLNLGFKMWLEDYEKRRGSKNASQHQI
jgi:hypothetical protein